MAQRTVCLCNGKHIGIESIYTIIDGKQINIPEKVEWLRKKSRASELFCPCGCGRNLILVAGDQNLKEQHFRVKDGDFELECEGSASEGRHSINSKIVLKCWLDDKLKCSDLESRVPIKMISDSDRKYEFTFLSREKRIGLCYYRDRANISDDKFEILEANSARMKLIYIADIANSRCEGQYPEWMMKIQSRQGYCMFLKCDDGDYYKSALVVSYFDKNIDGIWEEIIVAESSLNDFSIDVDQQLVFHDELVKTCIERKKASFEKAQEDEKLRREKAIRDKQAFLEKIEAEQRLREEKRRKEIEEQVRRQKEEEAERLEKERKKKAEEKHAEEVFYATLEEQFNQQETQIRDPKGNRLIKCEFCGKIARDTEFGSYGGIGHINLGTCYECSKNNPAVNEKTTKIIESVAKEKVDRTKCPWCGGNLKTKSGRFGNFVGCSNYPECKYTRKK